MSRINKTILLFAGIVLLVAGVLFIPSRGRVDVAAQSTPAPTVQRSISVSGQGSVQAQPDRAYITLGVQTNAQTASEALSQNSDQMQALLSALTSAGIANTDIQTQSVQLYPNYETQTNSSGGQQTQQSKVTSFTAANTVQVTVRNLDNLGDLIDQAVQAGGNRVENISFDIANPSTLLDDAREAAFQDAMHKAQQLATLAGAQLGPVITINENSYLPSPVQQTSVRAEAASSTVPVSPGSQTLTVDVQVTFDIQVSGQ